MAWRNLMVLTINAGIELKLFSLRPDDNCWPGADNREYCLFPFYCRMACRLKAACVMQAGGELSVHAAVNPNGEWVRASNAEFHEGDAFAASWLERRNGAWL